MDFAQAFGIWWSLHLGLKLLTIVLTVFVALNVTLGPRRAWVLWQRFGQTVGNGLARAVLTVFYFTVMPVFAVITRGSRDVLGTGRRERLWGEPDAKLEGLAEGRRQY